MANSPFAAAAPNFATVYERALVPVLFRPWAEVLVERAALGLGDHVLDVACGTGICARLARERAGSAARVVGVDVSPPMLTVAREVSPDVEFREGSATALPVEPDEKFDVVFCHQGIQFFPDKSAAAGEMRRVMAPGGRLSAACWRSDEEHPLLLELRRIAERRLGAIHDMRHSFSDAGGLASLLEDAGFTDVHVEPMTRTHYFPDAKAFLKMNAMAMVGMSARGKDMAEEERVALVGAIASDSLPAIAERQESGGLVYELSSNVATARA